MSVVLIVEDRETHADFLRKELEGKPGIDIRVVSSLQEVDALAARNPCPFDCAVVDLQIFEKKIRRAADTPNTRWGIAALSRLTSILAANKIMVVSSYAHDGTVAVALKTLGLGDRNFTKPIQSKVFAGNVLAML